jgi:hypothetical protein
MLAADYPGDFGPGVRGGREELNLAGDRRTRAFHLLAKPLDSGTKIVLFIRLLADVWYAARG